ncbi:MAG: HesA/MoeB/ThiF family protein [bacterium]
MNGDQQQRYSRQINLLQLGEEGQQALLNARVLIIGMGGLGSPAAMYLAAAGVGRLVISDFDRVEVSNLQRQIIHRQSDIGELKAESARRTLLDINPACDVEALDFTLDQDTLGEWISAVDLVVDCSDNFPTRFAVNRACVAASKPLVSGAAIRMEGQIISFLPGEDGPCYQCLYDPDLGDAETCAMEGVLAPLVGVIGSLQAMQAVMILAGMHQHLVGKMILVDGERMDWRTVKVPQDPSCPVCSNQ